MPSAMVELNKKIELPGVCSALPPHTADGFGDPDGQMTNVILEGTQ
jgi:hypothetical protein